MNCHKLKQKLLLPTQNKTYEFKIPQLDIVHCYFREAQFDGCERMRKKILQQFRNSVLIYSANICFFYLKLLQEL